VVVVEDGLTMMKYATTAAAMTKRTMTTVLQGMEARLLERAGNLPSRARRKQLNSAAK